MDYEKWITYWKTNVSDAMKADIEIENSVYFEIEDFDINTIEIRDLSKVNHLIDKEETRLNKKKGITKKDNQNWTSIQDVQVVISPFKLKPIVENLVFLKDKKAKFPFWFFAQLNRKGKLSVPTEVFPIFQRKFLEPQADEKTEFIFSSVEKVDQATVLGKEEFDNYEDYICYIKKIFNAVVGQSVENYKTEEYETIPNGIILLPEEEINAAAGIIQLYEKILKENKPPELLKSFVTLSNPMSHEPLNVYQFIDSNFLHMGQMGDSFPLSISQRKALYTFLSVNDKVFAVNGPPGTGKTTLLQSVVANKVVESVINETDAPIILACSTNNQAVTNIIESFSKVKVKKKGTLYERWLPDIKGYATYLPSNTKTEKELGGINYKKISGEGLFGNIECDTYLQKAKSYFIAKSSEYLKSPVYRIEEATGKLRKEIVNIYSQLKIGSSLWKEYKESELLFENTYLVDTTKEKYYKDTLLNTSAFLSDIAHFESLEKEIITYFNNEPFLRKVLCLFGFKFALNSRISEIKILLRDSLIESEERTVFTKEVLLGQLDNKIKVAKALIRSIENWQEWKIRHSIKGNPPATEKLYWDFEYLKLKEKEPIPNCFYDELDVTLRFQAFQLASRYWEGKYLLRLETDLKSDYFNKSGLDAVVNRWKRQAMLTPCFVSTFYMAPKFFSYFKFLRKSDDGKNLFDTPALFDFIDLLIVDEAGQVSPEVGVATFSLAKQALVVGDIKQIEPVWNITEKIDIGNLRKCGLIIDYGDLIYEREYDPKGFLSSTGSIMKMAQNACNVQDKNLDEKGALLVEHRRCYDEIIDYCNRLAYHGQLRPLKGRAGDKVLFPPMFCIHVEGNSTVLQSSRQNEKEAEAIANWLAENKNIIENKYNKSIEETVGIVTPFTGQKKCLKQRLKNKGFDIDKMKIGTVHALQGAERKIVLFSMVYGDGDTGTMFFDRNNKPNMLNVAVSRAEDNFIVFANTKILNKSAKTPSGLLASCLVLS